MVQPAGALVGRCRTLDQARAVVTFLDAASEKTLRSTVALTAARGRGKVGTMHHETNLMCLIMQYWSVCIVTVKLIGLSAIASTSWNQC